MMVHRRQMAAPRALLVPGLCRQRPPLGLLFLLLGLELGHLRLLLLPGLLRLREHSRRRLRPRVSGWLAISFRSGVS